jgi:hypothetical protein
MILSISSPSDISDKLANKLKIKRKWLGHSRAKAAEYSGVPASTIRRFEDSGEISLRQLLMLCQTYDDLDTFPELFSIPQAKTVDDLLKSGEFNE